MRIASIWLSLLFATAASAAPPKIDSVFPIGVGRGETATIVIVGQLTPWPVSVWTDTPSVEIASKEKPGEFEVRVAADAPCGVCWFRLFNAEGASALSPLLIGTLPTAAEVEPNNAPGEAQLLAGSTAISGRLEKRGDVDTFAIELKQGQTLVAALDANRLLGSPMDGVLQICDASGAVLMQNDDERGLDPLTVFAAPRDGKFSVRVFAFPATADSSIGFAGGPNFLYQLTVTTGGFLDHALPLAVRAGEKSAVALFGWNLPADATAEIAAGKPELTDEVQIFHPQFAGVVPLRVATTPVAGEQAESAASGNATPLAIPAVISGRIESAGDEDVFRFAAEKGKRLRCRVESRNLGSSLDAVLQLADATGKEIAKIDDAGENRDPAADFNVPADGVFDVSVRDVFGHGGFRHVYRLTIDEVKPDFRVTVAQDSFVIEAGKTVEIPVAIDRTDGHAAELEVFAEGLPAGVTAASVKSVAGGETGKSVKLVLTAATDAAASSGPIRLLARPTGDDENRRIVRFPAGSAGATHHAVWLTVRPAP